MKGDEVVNRILGLAVVCVMVAGLGEMSDATILQKALSYNFDELSTSRIAVLRATYQDQCDRQYRASSFKIEHVVGLRR